MPVFPLRGGVASRGGSGFSLGPETNTFGDTTTANRAAAEALRDAYTTANAAWLALYNGNRNFFIELVWNGGDVRQRRDVPGTAWEDGTNILIGRRGPIGNTGPQGPGPILVDNLNIVYGSDSAVQLNPPGGAMESDGEIYIFQYTRDFTPADTNVTISVNGSTATRIRLQDGNSLRDMTLRDIVRYNIYSVFKAPTFWHFIGGTRYAEASGVKAYAKTGGGLVPDAEIDPVIMRDAEFTKVAVEGLLNLSAQEVDDLLTGVSITNRIVSFTQNDGTTATITIPAGSGMADGTIAPGSAFSADGSTLTIPLTIGGPIVINVPAVLRQAAGMADGVIDGTDFDPATYVAALERSVGADIDLDLSPILTAINALIARVTALEGGGMMPHALTRYAALRAMGAGPADFTEANFLAVGATTSTTQDITTPASNTDMVVGLAVPTSEGPLTGVDGLDSNGQLNNQALMIRANFLPAIGDPEITLNIDGTDHYIYATSGIVRSILLGAIGYRLTQTAP